MITLSRRSVRTGIVTAASTVLLATALPATASADVVDDMLAKLPSGQITCEQAGKYWTSEAEYNKIAAQAKAAAFIHPRGAEIRAALARVDEAADRCDLRGGGQTPVETPVEDNPTQPETPQPEPAPSKPNPQNPDTPDTPDTNENDRDDQSPAPTPEEDTTPDNDNPGTTTPGNDNTENVYDWDDYETPALGSSDILVLLGLLAESGSSR